MIMSEQLEEQRGDFLLEVRTAIKRNQVVVMILYSAADDDYVAMSNGYGIEIDEVLKFFCEMPFIGRVSPQDAFERWNDYYDDVESAEIYGFQLDDGQVQISILDYYIMPPEETEH